MDSKSGNARARTYASLMDSFRESEDGKKKESSLNKRIPRLQRVPVTFKIHFRAAFSVNNFQRRRERERPVFRKRTSSFDSCSLSSIPFSTMASQLLFHQASPVAIHDTQKRTL